MKNTIPVVLGIVVAFAAFNAPAQQFQWPEEPENLQVLPEDTSGNELGAIMRGFVSSLDVRCEHCHVGEGNDLIQFDFSPGTLTRMGEQLGKTGDANSAVRMIELDKLAKGED